MTHEQVQEIFTFKGSTAHLFGFAVNIPEGDLALLVGNDIAFADHSLVQISGQIRQCRDAGSDSFTIDNPFGTNAFGDRQLFFVQPVQETCPENPGQGFFIKQILALFRTLARAFLLNKYLPFFAFHCRRAGSMPPAGITT